MIRVKICCIGSVEEARLAIQEGASAVGLVSAMPSGPGVIAEETIREITATIPPAVGSFLLTSQTAPANIIAQQRRCRPNTLQLCDRLTAAAHSALREALPGVSLVQVVHVTDETAVDEALELGPRVDALLLDSGRPNAVIKELGGTGRTHNWALSRQIVRLSAVPVFLAGGLCAANVGEAIRAVRPFGVDLCTGVRTNGLLDPQKLRRFMAAVKAATAPADNCPQP